jgi:hypothetical protein
MKEGTVTKGGEGGRTRNNTLELGAGSESTEGLLVGGDNVLGSLGVLQPGVFGSDSLEERKRRSSQLSVCTKKRTTKRVKRAEPTG